MINNNQQTTINNTTQEAIVNDSSGSSAFGLQVNATDSKTKTNIESNISTDTDTDTNIDKRKVVEQKNTETLKILGDIFSYLDKTKNTEDQKNEQSSLKKSGTDSSTDVEKSDPNIRDDEDLVVGLSGKISNLKALTNSAKQTMKDDNLFLEQSEKLLALEEDTSQLCVIC